ncbi:MAG: FliM/FliN family flagellar motor switch protein [Firmicutes bacterium]|nr:FliM/FliN family flagellar motor switch protein [Bacillota bacterium]
MADANRPLSQAEIDALLEALSSANESSEAASQPAPSASEDPVAPNATSTAPATAPLVSQAGERHDTGMTLDPRLRRTMHLPVTVSVSLGLKQLPVQSLLNWGVGTQVVLDYRWQEPVQIKINGLPVGDGRVVLVGNNFGIEVRHWGQRGR